METNKEVVITKRKQKQVQLELFPVLNTFENFNTSIAELRTGLYAPIDKITSKSKTYLDFVANGKKRIIKTSWGEMVVKGNILTQTHRDLLDCILASAKEINITDKGGVSVYFKISEVLQIYGKTTGNYKWLKTKLDEIQTTAIGFDINSSTDDEAGDSINILSRVSYSKKHDAFVIVFSSEYREYVESQLTIDYKEELPKLLKVEDGMLKAIIRFFWTHENLNLSLDQTFETIGLPITSDRMMRDRKKTIRDSADLLETFGIIYNEKQNFIYKKGTNKINFIPPAGKPKLIKEENNIS